MRPLGEGDTSLTVPHLDRRHEIGEIAGSIEVFRQRLADADRMRSEQDAEKARGAAEQKAALRRMAGAFEASIGSIVGAVASAATEMQTTAETMSATAEESNRQAMAVSGPAGAGRAKAETAASATGELNASLTEIRQRGGEASEIPQGC